MTSSTDTPPGSPAARRLGRQRRAELRVRARRIRLGVASAATSLFIAAFAVIYVQLASGHDPALVADAKRRAEAALTAQAKRDRSKGTDSSTAAGSGASSSSSPSAVTTSQS